MFSTIPQQRLILYGVIAGVLPLILVLLNMFGQLSDVDNLKNHLDVIHQNILSRESKQAVNLSVKEHFKNADHFYIDKQIESIRLLEPEIESLKKIAAQNNVVDNEAVKKRLEYLTNTNTIVFTEGVVQKNPYFQETTETLVHTVEVNLQNIAEILAKIEGVKMESYHSGLDRPQMIITDFRIDKKNVDEKNEIYMLNLKLIKREFS